jgi:hypothetical protein
MVITLKPPGLNQDRTPANLMTFLGAVNNRPNLVITSLLMYYIVIPTYSATCSFLVFAFPLFIYVIRLHV